MLLAIALLPCCDKEHDEAAFTNPFDPDNPETHGDPYNLQVNAQADGVQLKWDKVANVSETIVYRSTSPDGGFERIGTSTSGEYVDTDTQTGVTYYYQVRAYARGVEASGSRLTNASTVRINTPPTSAIVHHELDKNTLLVQWKGSDADGSVKSYLIKLDDGEWTDVGTQTEFRKEDLAEGVHRFYLKSQDNLGAEEAEAQVLEFTVDTSPPLSAGITIKEGNTTNSRSVTLSLSASDATEMRISNSSSFSGSSWEAYSSTKNWTLSSGDGTKTVYAQFRDAAGNESSTVSDTIVLDASAPSGSIAINGGASYTTNRAVTLSLSATDATEMRISNSSGFSGSSWEAYSSTRNWTLSSGDGAKTVYAQFRDSAGNESSTVSDTIVLDASAPSGSISINSGASTTASLNVTLSLSASDVTEMRMSNSSSFTGSSWEAYSSTRNWTLSSGDGTKTVYVQFRDAAGNESSTVSGSIVLDTQAPSSSISINSGASYATDRAVTLILLAIGVTEMRISNSSSFSGSSWETYSGTKSWTLSSGDGTKTVYAQFRDAAGNESGVVSDSIVLDTQAPSGSISINSGASTTASLNVTLSLSASGAADMRISDSSSFSGSSWETYSSSKSWTLSSGDGTKTVYVQFRDAAGNESSTVSESIVLDTQAPIGSISINSGASYATERAVTLTLSATGADDMRISNSISFSGISWEAYSSTKSWTLSSGDGMKRVYAQFRDSAGNESSTVSDSIVLDTQAPIGSISINIGAFYTTDRAVTLILLAIGVTDMRISDSSSFSGISWETYSGTKNWTLSSGDGTKTVYAQFRDLAGNEGSVVSDSIELDTQAPSGSISINGGASTTASLNVTLSLSVSDATEMRISNSSSFSGSSWETYSSTKSWTLSSGDGTKTVYAQFRDAAGNESSTVSDSIAVSEPLPWRTISLPSISTEPGSTVTVEISIDDATGIAGGDIELEYDSAVLDLTAVRPANLFKDFSLAVKTDIPDKVQITMAAFTGLAGGEGAMFEIDFQVKSSASGETALILSDVSLFNEMGTHIETTVINGSVMVRSVIDDMALIPAGEFSMGDALNEGKSDELPVHTVYLDAFYMDKYEVTNTQYAAFLNQYGKNADASGNELLDIGSSDCQIEEVDGSFRAKSGYENHPVVEMSWYGAVAYAEFYGKRLPTEAEWEKAARGGLAGKRYPWGDNISHDDANYSGTGGRDVWNGTSPVGSFAPNGYGLYDMAGNVWEWCADWYSSGYYASTTRSNPQGPGSGTYRVMRGGGWGVAPEYLRVAHRFVADPIYTGTSRGFRCVASPND